MQPLVITLNFLQQLEGLGTISFIAMSAPNTHLYQQAMNLLRMVMKKEGFWQASVVLKVAEKRKEGTGANLHGGVLELAVLAGVRFRTELFPGER